MESFTGKFFGALGKLIIVTLCVTGVFMIVLGVYNIPEAHALNPTLPHNTVRKVTTVDDLTIYEYKSSYGTACVIAKSEVTTVTKKSQTSISISCN